MLKDNDRIKVLNRDNGAVLYTIQEMGGLRRVFQAGETKEITFEELKKLSYMPGGRELLEDSLVIQNDEAIEELLGHVELEYKYTADDVKKLLQTGSYEEFLDCLDFAPAGVIDLIKTMSVELPLNDVAKREAIYEKTGFNVENALRIKRETQEPDKEEKKPERRVRQDQSKASSAPVRRVVKKES